MSRDGVPLPFLTLQIGIFLQIVTGIMIMMGFYVKIAALLLIPFTIVSVFMFHPFWKHRGELFALNFSVFMANMTISIGALLLIIVQS